MFEGPAQHPLLFCCHAHHKSTFPAARQLAEGRLRCESGSRLGYGSTDEKREVQRRATTDALRTFTGVPLAQLALGRRRVGLG